MFKTMGIVLLGFALIWATGVLADEHLLFYANFNENLGNNVKDFSQYGNDGELMNGQA